MGQDREASDGPPFALAWMVNEIDGYVDLGLATSTLDENRQLLGGPSLASRSWPTLLTTRPYFASSPAVMASKAGVPY